MTEQSTPPAPTVGRIVHYVSYGTPGGEYPSVCRAAVVTEVSGHDKIGGSTWYVGLAVLNPEGMFFNQGVRQDEDRGYREGGTWHWPERDSD